MNRDEVIAHGDAAHHGHHGAGGDPNVVELPAPTAAPIIFALGVSLGFLGLVTHWGITALGIAMSIPGIVSWFNQVLPHEAHEGVPIETAEMELERAEFAIPAAHGSRHQIQAVTSFSMWTGVKGGIAGGIAMTVPATLFSVLRFHSVWYALNLLAAGGFTSWATQSDAFLAQFHLRGLLAATAIHGTTSLLVGMLYAAMLPIFPKKPILTAGFIMPLLWTGLIYTSLGIVSPILNQRIDWFWFVVSQVAFGLVAGFVVNLDANVRNAEFRALPFAVRAGLHTDRSADLDGRETEKTGRMGYINEALNTGDTKTSGKGSV
jgi:hypothetical protein